MANIDTLNEWNLTPNGWVKNEAKTRRRHADSTDGVPEDRLLTIQDWEYERSTWSEMTDGCSYTFRSEDSESLKAAVEQYGKAPEEYLMKRLENQDPFES